MPRAWRQAEESCNERRGFGSELAAGIAARPSRDGVIAASSAGCRRDIFVVDNKVGRISVVPEPKIGLCCVAGDFIAGSKVLATDIIGRRLSAADYQLIVGI